MEIRSVIVSSPLWTLNGVNIFSLNLVRGLKALGVPAHLLLTRTDLPDPKPMGIPSDIEIERFEAPAKAGWKARCEAMRNYLESRAPCIYIPNHDYEHSAVSSMLSDKVGVIGIMHNSRQASEDEHAVRLGRYWNALVGVSQEITERLKRLAPDCAERVVNIPYGVVFPNQYSARPPRTASEPIRIVYSGRLDQEQKRVHDLPKIMKLLAEKNVPAILTVVGGGPEEERLKAESSTLIDSGMIKFVGILASDQLAPILRESDVILLVSRYEGLPLGLIEAQGYGCVPVVSDIPSGIPEVVQHEANGFVVAVGDNEGFAGRIAQLQQNSEMLRGMSERTYETVAGKFRVENMAQNYLNLIEKIDREISDQTYHRNRAPMRPSPYRPRLTMMDRMESRIENLGRYARKLIGNRPE